MTPRRLSDFRAQPAPELPPWRETNSVVMAFDQSIANTGWALVGVADQQPYVLKTGMVKTEPTEKTGFEDIYLRAVYLRQAYAELLSVHDPDVVVHEMPAIYGMRTESSLIASIILRLVLETCYNDPVMYAAQRVKRVIAGKANASKQEIKLAVKSLCPDVVNHKPRNEHTNDAVALALCYFLDRTEGGRLIA